METVNFRFKMDTSKSMETLKSLTGPIVLARTRAPDLESVRKMNCWGSEIEDISVVREMPNLEVCSVSVNDISSLKDFQCCCKLQELYIRNNKIASLTDICYLKSLKDLRILWLADNPCASSDNYRMTVLRNLPNLQKLDNIVVQPEEVTASLEQGEELCLPETDSDPEEGEATPAEEPAECKITKEPDPPNEGSTQNGGLQATDPVTLSWAETNKIREQLGLKPLAIEKISSPRSAPTSSTRARNAHVLQAVLILVRDLDRDSLEIVDTAIRKRLETL